MLDAERELEAELEDVMALPSESDLEFAAELDQLMSMLSESDLQSESEGWKTQGTGVCPRPARVTISGFPRYHEDIGSLSASERKKLRGLAALIVGSHQVGCPPILQVNVVGHADKDVLRGPDFERQISTRRALAIQRALQQLIPNPAILRTIVWQARGVGAKHPLVKSPTSELQRTRNRRVDVVLSTRVTASYPVLLKYPDVGYGWVMQGPPSPVFHERALESPPLTFPDPVAVFDSQRTPFKWICSLVVDFGPEVLPGPIITGNRINVRGTGTLVSRRHVLTAGHCLFTQGHPGTDIFGNPVISTLKAVSVTVVPGRDGGKTPALEPQGRISTTKFRVSPTWERSNATNSGFDYGLITLDEALPPEYGFWSSGNTHLSAPSDSTLRNNVLHCSGYPSRFCPPPDPASTVRCDDATRGTVQFQMSGRVIDTSSELFDAELKIAGGHSGSPTWLHGATGSLELVGIATASRAQFPEIAVRMRNEIITKLRTWINEDGVSPNF